MFTSPLQPLYVPPSPYSLVDSAGQGKNLSNTLKDQLKAQKDNDKKAKVTK
tara:strand:+ start:352 stop:504 length:153 start_codon:yes stop_codon:yes gene_type:complete